MDLHESDLSTVLEGIVVEECLKVCDCRMNIRRWAIQIIQKRWREVSISVEFKVEFKENRVSVQEKVSSEIFQGDDRGCGVQQRTLAALLLVKK